MNTNFPKRVETALKSIGALNFPLPKTAVVLGSGLGEFVDTTEGDVIPFDSIKGFPETTVKGHRGVLKIGPRGLICAGRFHYYEGWEPDDIVLPIFLFHALGIQRIILTNASGGLNPEYKPGELVLIKDHLNLTGENPLRGENFEAFGPRFPDMSEVYPRKLRSLTQKLFPLKEGVYAGLSGPSYETPAEIKMLRTLGADMVGMSTVHEAIAASYLGMEVLGISCITNMAAGMSDTPLNHDEVITTGKQVAENFTNLLSSILHTMG